MDKILEEELQKSELEIFKELLSLWPFLDDCILQWFTEFREFRFPKLHPIIEKMADIDIRNLQLDVLTNLNNFFLFFIDQVPEDQKADFTNIFKQNFNSSNPPNDEHFVQEINATNLASIIDRFIYNFNTYLSTLYQFDTEKRLNEIRNQFPALFGNARNEFIKSKVFTLISNENPQAEPDKEEKESLSESHDKIILSTGFLKLNNALGDGGLTSKSMTLLECKTVDELSIFISGIMCKNAIEKELGALYLCCKLNYQAIRDRLNIQSKNNISSIIPRSISIEPISLKEDYASLKIERNLSIVYSPRIKDYSEIELEIQNYIHLYGKVPRLIVIDSFQDLLNELGNHFYSSSQEFMTISNNLQEIAEKYNNHIIITSLINPSMHNYLMSGQHELETVTDLVILIQKVNNDNYIFRIRKNNFGNHGVKIDSILNLSTFSFEEK